MVWVETDPSACATPQRICSAVACGCSANHCSTDWRGAVTRKPAWRSWCLMSEGIMPKATIPGLSGKSQESGSQNLDQRLTPSNQLANDRCARHLTGHQKAAGGLRVGQQQQLGLVDRR